MSSYYTILTSLPRHHRQYNVDQTPLSRIQLERRIQSLPVSERECLYMLEDTVWTSWFDQERTVKDILRQAKVFLQTHQNFILELIDWYFNIRSLLVALRLRRDTVSLPEHVDDIWHTRWSARILNNWNVPDFGLKNIYPWLPDANARLINNQADILEKILIEQLWKHLDHIEDRHYFDFEAIIIYLIRWDIVNYWSQFNQSAAIKRMNESVSQIVMACPQAHHIINETTKAWRVTNGSPS